MKSMPTVSLYLFRVCTVGRWSIAKSCHQTPLISCTTSAGLSQVLQGKTRHPGRFTRPRIRYDREETSHCLFKTSTKEEKPIRIHAGATMRIHRGTPAATPNQNPPGRPTFSLSVGSVHADTGWSLLP